MIDYTNIQLISIIIDIIYYTVILYIISFVGIYIHLLSERNFIERYGTSIAELWGDIWFIFIPIAGQGLVIFSLIISVIDSIDNIKNYFVSKIKNIKKSLANFDFDKLLDKPVFPPHLP